MKRYFGSYILCTVILTVFTLSINFDVINASSYSTNYSLNDESLNFGYSAGQMESTTYSSDLSDIYWTERNLRSSSFTIVDSNSKVVKGQPPLPPPPPPPPDDDGGSGGERPFKPGEEIEFDEPAIVPTEPVEEQEEDLRPAPEEPEPEPAVPEKPGKDEPALPVEPEKAYPYEDNDGCSLKFENKFMNTNPYKNDTDNDEIEDCDEALVYGLDPNIFNNTDNTVGIADYIKFIYSTDNPFFTGRMDFGLEFEPDSDLSGNMEIIKKEEPRTEIGLFKIDIADDLNFSNLSTPQLEDGIYEVRINFEENKQEVADLVEIDSGKNYEKLDLSEPENGLLNKLDGLIKINGKTGPGYGVVGIWKKNKEFIDVSAVVADNEGIFNLPAPRALADGEYSLAIFGLYKNLNDIIQTNYENLDFYVNDGTAYLKEEIIDSDYHKASLIIPLKQKKPETDSAKIVPIKEDPLFIYLLSFAIFLIFSSITFYAICRKRK